MCNAIPDRGATLWVTPPSPDGDATWLDAVLDEIDARGPAAVLVVPPSPLARSGIVDALLARRPAGLFLPRIETPDEIVQTSEPVAGREPPPLPAGARRALLAELVSRKGGELVSLGGARDFPGVVQAIDHFFQALARQRIWTARALNTHVHVYRRGRLRRLDEDVIALYDAYRELVPAAPGPGAHDTPAAPGDGRPADGLATRLELAGRRLADPQALEAALRHVKLLVIQGFDDFTPLQLEIARRLATIVGRTVVSVEHVAAIDGIDAWENEPLLQALGPLTGHLRHDAADLDAVARVACDLGTGRTDRLPAVPIDVSPDRMTLTEHVDEVAEVTATARAIAAHLSEPDGSPRDVAVGLADPARYLPLVREIFPRHGVPFRSPIGIPLMSVPPISLALAILETVAEGFRRAQVELLLRSPYVAIPGAQMTTSAELDSWARAARVVGGDGDPDSEWLAALGRLRDEILAANRRGATERAAAVELATADLRSFFAALEPLTRARHEPIDARELRTRLLDVLQAFAVWDRAAAIADQPHLTPAVRRDAGARRRLGELLDAMVRALSALPDPPSMTLDGWLPRLRALLAEETVSPMEETGAGVQVVTVTDLRHLRVRTSFAIGLTEASLPRRQRRELLYPEVHDPARDFLHHRSPIAEDPAALMREVARRRSVHLSWPARASQSDQLPAAIVERLRDVLELRELPPPDAPWPVPDELAARAVEAASTPARAADLFAPLLDASPTATLARAVLHGLVISEQRRHERPTIHTGFLSETAFPGTEGTRRAPGGSHVYSATELETYATCGYRYFASRVLRLGELERVEEELSPLTRGAVLHRILHRFYARRIASGDDPPLAADRIDGATVELAEIARDVLASLPADDLLWRAAKATMAGELVVTGEGATLRPVVLTEFLRSELARCEDGWRPRALEWAFGMGDEPAARIATEHGPVHVKGKIDRVDQHVDGAGLVLDYKSGAPPKARDAREGTRFQLPIYLYAYASRTRATGDDRAGAPAVSDGPPRAPDREPVSWDAAYYPLRAQDRATPHAFVSGSRRGPGAVDLDALARDLATRVGRLTTAIAAGSFPLTVLPDGDAPCRYCAYRPLCRVNPTRDVVRRSRLAGHPDVPTYLPGEVPS